MKSSVVISFLVLAAGIGLGWQNHQRMDVLREASLTHRAQAAKLGVSALLSDSPQISRRVREDSVATAELAAAKVIQLAEQIESLPKTVDGNALKDKLKTESENLSMSLNSAQLKIVIAKVREDAELSEEVAQAVLLQVLMDLASREPHAVLDVFANMPTLMSEPGQYVFAFALSRWASDDPQSALSWSREQQRITKSENLEPFILAGAAAIDPQLACKLIGEMSGNPDVLLAAVCAASSAKDRFALIAGLRMHLATLSDAVEKDRTESKVFYQLGRNVAQESFEIASQSLELVTLTQSELQAFWNGLTPNIKGFETAKWIDWFSKNSLPDQAAEGIEQLMGRWTYSNHEAAGRWLRSTADGPTKNAANRGYQKTIAEYGATSVLE